MIFFVFTFYVINIIVLVLGVKSSSPRTIFYIYLNPSLFLLISQIFLVFLSIFIPVSIIFILSPIIEEIWRHNIIKRGNFNFIYCIMAGSFIALIESSLELYYKSYLHINNGYVTISYDFIWSLIGGINLILLSAIYWLSEKHLKIFSPLIITIIFHLAYNFCIDNL